MSNEIEQLKARFQKLIGRDMPVGLRYIARRVSSAERLRLRKRRPRKPAPASRAELVARQKKYRARVGNYDN